MQVLCVYSMASSFEPLRDSCVCEHMCLCIYMCFWSFSFCLFCLILNCLFCFVLSYFYYYSLDACLFSIRDGKGVDLDGRSGGRNWEDNEQGKSQSEFIVWKKSIYNKNGGSWQCNDFSKSYQIAIPSRQWKKNLTKIKKFMCHKHLLV